MRIALTTLLVLAAVQPASAVTLTNLDSESRHVFVCDDRCGPSFGEAWGSARDFWLAAGESTAFDCSGECFIGLYPGEDSPTLGDMAFADDDELFRGNESGYIRDGIVTHKAN